MLVWLVDFDGKIENLALMRLSAWHKTQGDTVRLKTGTAYPELFEIPDRVYISCIFRWNRKGALMLADAWGDRVQIGGTGVDIQKTLSLEIANTSPDYSLYGKSRAVGFISRGCIRRCPWCIVPAKEGALQRVSTAREIVRGFVTHSDGWWPENFLALDNNFLALEDYQDDLRWLAEHKVKIDFNQGLDARLMTDEAARLLAACEWSSEIRLALDSDGQKRAVGLAVERLVEREINPDKICVYILIGFGGLESDLDRLFYLRSLGVRVYPMGYRDTEFAVGDHVENKPIATVDGIVYRVEGDTVRFCDEYGIKYKMSSGSLRPRYEKFSREETREILRINAPVFMRKKGRR